MSVDVVLKDRNGSERTYSVESAIALPTPGGGTKLFYANGATLDTIMNHTALSGSYVDSEITSIPSFALAGYSQITSLAFPACVSIGEHALDGCSDLSELSVDWAGFSESGLGSYALAGTAISEFKPENGVRLAEGLFRNCLELSEVWLHCVEDGYIPISELASYAFAGCSRLTTIRGYASGSEQSAAPVKFIGDSNKAVGVFEDCIMLSEIRIGNGFTVDRIPSSVFQGCIALTTISNAAGYLVLEALGDNQPAVGARAFYSCVALQSISFRVQDVSKLFGQSAFYGCHSLVSVYLNIVASYSTSASFLSKLGALDVPVFGETPMRDSSYLGRFGSIYISPSRYVSWMKSAYGWSVYSSRMVGYNAS